MKNVTIISFDGAPVGAFTDYARAVNIVFDLNHLDGEIGLQTLQVDEVGGILCDLINQGVLADALACALPAQEDAVADACAGGAR